MSKQFDRLQADYNKLAEHDNKQWITIQDLERQIKKLEEQLEEEITSQ